MYLFANPSNQQGNISAFTDFVDHLNHQRDSEGSLPAALEAASFKLVLSVLGLALRSNQPTIAGRCWDLAATLAPPPPIAASPRKRAEGAAAFNFAALAELQHSTLAVPRGSPSQGVELDQFRKILRVPLVSLNTNAPLEVLASALRAVALADILEAARLVVAIPRSRDHTTFHLDAQRFYGDPASSRRPTSSASAMQSSAGTDDQVTDRAVYSAIASLLFMPPRITAVALDCVGPFEAQHMALLAHTLHLRPKVKSLDLRGSQVAPGALALARTMNPAIDDLLATPAGDLNLNSVSLKTAAAGHQDHILCMVQQDDGLVATGSRDGTVRLWTQSGKLVVRFILRHAARSSATLPRVCACRPCSAMFDFWSVLLTRSMYSRATTGT